MSRCIDLFNAFLYEGFDNTKVTISTDFNTKEFFNTDISLDLEGSYLAVWHGEDETFFKGLTPEYVLKASEYGDDAFISFFKID